MSNFQHIAQSVQAIEGARIEAARKVRAATDAQIALPHLLSGEAMFATMKRAVDDLVIRAPKDHDVLIQLGDLSITEARFIEPHTFLFEGFNEHGHRAAIVCHFSQVIVKVIYGPKRTTERVVSRVIQGFSLNEPAA
jgi:hypothetical protein